MEHLTLIVSMQSLNILRKIPTTYPRRCCFNFCVFFLAKFRQLFFVVFQRAQIKALNKTMIAKPTEEKVQAKAKSKAR